MSVFTREVHFNSGEQNPSGKTKTSPPEKNPFGNWRFVFSKSIELRIRES